MELLRPSQLEAGAVVPQCCDNQFVPEDVFWELQAAADLTLDHPDIGERRRSAIHEELIRSLVYAPQVVLNRAFVFNNGHLFGLITDASGDDLRSLFSADNRAGLQPIVPYLYAETSLTGNVDFDRDPEGAKAVDHLIEAIGFEPDCVRFHPLDDINDQEAPKMGQRFADYFAATLVDLDREPASILMSELLQSEDDRQRLRSDDNYWNGFRDALFHLSDYAADYKRDRAKELRAQQRNPEATVRPILSRERLYRDVLIPGAGGDPAAIRQGRFGLGADPIVAPFVFELKKLIDLRYNTNLPDLLERYSFTPMGFPTRSALQDDYLRGDSADAIVDTIERLRAVRHDFVERHQRVQYLPVLDQLDLTDVVWIRSQPAWQAFIRTQSSILDDPLGRLVDGLPELHRTFADLQAVIQERYRTVARERHDYDLYVSVALSIGATSICFWLDDWGYIDDVLLSAGAAMIPQQVKGLAAKLLYNVIDTTTGKISERRSWAVEVARSEEIYTRQEAVDLIESIRSAGFTERGRGGPLAEQERG